MRSVIWSRGGALSALGLPSDVGYSTGTRWRFASMGRRHLTDGMIHRAPSSLPVCACRIAKGYCQAMPGETSLRTRLLLSWQDTMHGQPVPRYFCFFTI